MMSPKNNKKLLMEFLLIIEVGIFPLVALWNHNLGQIKSQIVFKPLIYTLVFILAVAILSFLIFKSKTKATLYVLATMVFCFSFGHIYDLLEKYKPLGLSIGFVKLVIIWIILYIGVLILNSKVKKYPKNLILFLNIGAAALVIINLLPIIIYGVKTNTIKNPTAEKVFTDQNDQPDIYYIVLDAYARQDVLKDLLNYDNSSFLTALKERGFFLPECAYSNYDITEATIGSVLNLDYLQNLGVSESDIGQDTADNAALIWNNKVWEYFKEIGYHFVTTKGFASFNDITNSDLYLNYSLDQGSTDDISQQRFINLYLNTTLFRVATEFFKNNPEKFEHLPNWFVYSLDQTTEFNYQLSWYNQNNYVLSSIEKIPDLKGNFLVYAHINSPHPPYVFRSDGSLNYPLETLDEKTSYANTLTYLNKRILEVVDQLVNKSDPSPIIIIQADHSIHMLTSGLDKHKILSAYYLPGDLKTPPYDTITPVNNFRLVIKDYFDPAFDLLPDKIFVKYLNDYQFIPSSCTIPSQ